jgi:hypothetical protein
LFAEPIGTAIRKVPSIQGDQIGRIFALWVIVCFGQFFENYRSNPHFGIVFSHG